MNKQKKEEREQRIKQLAQTNASANKIQQLLQEENLGIKRKELLAKVRMYRHQPKKSATQKYIPHKYRYVKQVSVYSGDRRYVFSSQDGRQLKFAVALAVERKKRPIRKITKAFAEDYIRNPKKYSSDKGWDIYDIRS